MPQSAGAFSWFVARRYLTARRRQAFISLISAVSILGVGVGVMAVIIALALMTGVQGELRDRIVGSTAHIYVSKLDGPFVDIEQDRARVQIPGVVASAPAILGAALIQAGGGDGVMLKGIDPALESDVTDIAAAVQSGSLEALTNRGPEAWDGIVLGADLADQLGLRLGDTVVAYSTATTSTPMGLRNRSRTLEVVGTVRFGVFEVDARWGFVSLATAQALIAPDGPNMLQLRVADIDDARRIRDQLQNELGFAYEVKDWGELNESLYSALWLEKVAISLAIGLIVMVAALNIVASLVLLVMEKTRDIAILRTMGARAGTIRRIFIYQGLAIGLIGTIGGAILGVGISLVADRFQLIKMPADVYQIAYLPFRVEPFDVVIVVVGAIGICLAATLYPSRQAGRIDPAEALRNQ
ncbi:MAG: ABC transporter permease [Acidobacteria bacterium]|nr:ABC transporter permease [Acidobacteriota bacterium]